MNEELICRVLVSLINGQVPDPEDMIAVHKIADPEAAARGEAASDHRTPEEISQAFLAEKEAGQARQDDEPESPVEEGESA